MLYVDGAVRAAHLPKLLGTYERELNHYIEGACALNFPLIVDIGAAEGYYAVGMAFRNPQARVIAFEMQATERSALAEAVSVNAVVNRLEIRGKCEPEDLERVLGDTPRPFVICDAEGYESVLLDPAIVPSLRRATILAELHEFVEKGITEEIRQRFAATHKINQIWQEERTSEDFPFKDFYTQWLPKSYPRWAVNESRPERMSWFWMEPVVTDHGPRND
jgi:predicted O-methyltransferase YrrM